MVNQSRIPTAERHPQRIRLTFHNAMGRTCIHSGDLVTCAHVTLLATFVSRG